MWLRGKCGILNMQINYTSKLYYKKYPFKITLLIRIQSLFKKTVWDKTTYPELAALPTWCNDNLSEHDHKIQNRYQRKDKNDSLYHQLIYVKDTATKDKVLANFGHSVLCVNQPLDNSHADSLEVRNITEVRENLLFKKFRYAVYFRYDRTQELFNWLVDYFKDTATVKVSGDYGWPRLYMEDDTELTMIKLTWQDKIDYIKSVRLITDTASTHT